MKNNISSGATLKSILFSMYDCYSRTFIVEDMNDMKVQIQMASECAYRRYPKGTIGRVFSSSIKGEGIENVDGVPHQHIWVEILDDKQPSLGL